MQPEDINSAVLESHLDTHDMPPPDLIIRTSGEQRLSNFLPWQSAYSRYSLPTCPGQHLQRKNSIGLLRIYTQRDRRFGALSPVNINVAQGT